MSLLVCCCGHDDNQHDWTFHGDTRVPCRRCDCLDFCDEWETVDDAAVGRHPANPTPAQPAAGAPTYPPPEDRSA